MAKQTTAQKPASSNQANPAASAPTADPKPPVEKPPVATQAAPIEQPAQKAKEQPTEDATETGPFVMISAPHDRRRAGMNFGKNPIKVDVATLTKEQVLALQNDPLLVIRPLAETDE